jgi:hypothetical protein
MKNIIFGDQISPINSKALSEEVNVNYYADNCFWSTFLALVNMGSRLVLQ